MDFCGTLIHTRLTTKCDKIAHRPYNTIPSHLMGATFLSLCLFWNGLTWMLAPPHVFLMIVDLGLIDASRKYVDAMAYFLARRMNLVIVFLLNYSEPRMLWQIACSCCHSCMYSKFGLQTDIYLQWGGAAVWIDFGTCWHGSFVMVLVPNIIHFTVR